MKAIRVAEDSVATISRLFDDRPAPTQEDAAMIAAKLFDRCKTLRRIELFGSVARGVATSNSNINLIVCVDDRQVAMWLDYLDLEGFDDWSLDDVIRTKAFLRLVGISERDFQQLSGRFTIDISVLPIDWRELFDLIQLVGHRFNKTFAHNLTQDAKIFNSRFELFIKPTPQQ